MKSPDPDLEVMRNTMFRAYRHNDKARRLGSCNQSYMGSLAQNNLRIILGGRTVLSLDEAISNCTRKKAEQGILYLRTRGYLRMIGEE